MTYLVDTNVALRLTLQSEPQNGFIEAAVSRLRERGEVLFITAQILIEFQALATRPASANGLGMTAMQASIEANKLETVFPRLDETPEIYPAWRILANTYNIVGRQVFDARLVAVMHVYGVTHLLILDSGHFQRFRGITVVDPANVQEQA